MNRIKDFYALSEKRKKRFRRKYCLHPDAPKGCSDHFGAAHTVQRSMLEKFLAESQHVLKFSLDVNPRFDAILFAPHRVGINKASTFFGFCGAHDNAMFRPLEARGFNFEPQQVALLGFRAMSHELYNKQAHLDSHELLGDHMMQNPDLQTQDRKEYIEVMRLALKNACRNLETGWAQFSMMSTSEALSELRYFAVLFDSAPVYFASTAFLPEWDFAGKLLQDLDSIEAFHGICFSAWASNQNFAIIFSWHEKSDCICLPFIESLQAIDQVRWSNRILAMTFEVCENVVFNQSWWDKLDEPQRRLLSNRVPSGLLSRDRTGDSLRDDGLDAFPASVLQIFSNI